MEEREGPWDMFEIKSRGAMFDVRRSKKGKDQGRPTFCRAQGQQTEMYRGLGRCGAEGGSE